MQKYNRVKIKDIVPPIKLTPKPEDPLLTEAKEVMGELNQRMSIFTAHQTWLDNFHKPHLEVAQYKDLFDDTCFMIRDWLLNIFDKEEPYLEEVESIAERLFYIISTAPKDTMSLVTVASKLETDCQQLYLEYQDNIQAYSELVFHLKSIGIFTYSLSQNDHPVITPILTVKGELRTALEAKFSSALPQLGGVVGTMDAQGKGLLPGILFKGKSTRRQTPLNQKDREAITLVSKQEYVVDMNMVNNMKYYVPTITDTGLPISEREQEDARTAYYRFEAMAREADQDNTTLQLPTTEDSRGRFYNAATDPAVRLSLRSVRQEGKLTKFEQELLKGNQP